MLVMVGVVQEVLLEMGVAQEVEMGVVQEV